MNEDKKKWLNERILGFLEVIDECLLSTTYASDRPLYMSDIVTATRWLIRLHKGEPITDICQDIVSNKTNKHFGDYWKQGPWGDREAEGLQLLQDEVRKRFTPDE